MKIAVFRAYDITDAHCCIRDEDADSNLGPIAVLREDATVESGSEQLTMAQVRARLADGERVRIRYSV